MSAATTHESACTGPLAVDVRLSDGVCEIAAEERDTVSVEVAPADAHADRDVGAAQGTVVSRQPNGLEVRVPKGAGTARLLGRAGRVRAVLRVPVGSDVVVRADGADVSVSGAVGDLAAETGSGAVTAERVHGDVRAETSSGDILLGSVGGGARLRSGTGNVRTGEVGGSSVDAVTSSGALAVAAAGGDVRLKSGSGAVTLGSARVGTVTASTSSGRIRIGVAPGTRTEVKVSTSGGSVGGDLAAGRTDGAGLVRIHVTTGSGDIDVHGEETKAVGEG
ncbi:DUF4097 family beta strand repeat-containing protein [Streptomyces sp. NBC_00893]|uniref:DUF4097 family beta strand repeat-containing protein n=1 Tax=Streptomyces sp. NBC_00893 TaxID=2975862 RepID=UPI0022594049|nr:DUF4097 family beta strand repeat-containing protein [Streptomyces sp. NBC_00893]MCX4851544.1 DUF4097 domain-containing protein [Streptomyces sp. NBC_00893]